MVFGFEQILYQAATPEGMANSITALVTSIGSLSVTVGTVIGLVFTFIKARDAHGKAKQVEDTAFKIGQYATAFGAKTIENKENIKSITQLVLASSPEEARKTILQKQALIDALQKQIDADNAQLTKLSVQIPGDAQADNRDDLIRPSPDVLDLTRAIKKAEQR